MASVRLPVLRNLLDRHVRPLGHFQRRWAKVHDVRFVATHQPPAQDRYKDKLEQKAMKEGHSSISSMKEAYQDKIQAVRDAEANRPSIPPQEADAAAATAEAANSPPPSSAPSAQQSQTASPAPSTQPTTAVPGIKPLSSYLDVSKCKTLPAKEVEALWRLRHANNPRSICAAIPLETYNRIANTARKHRQFILPLPREVQVPNQPQSQGDQTSSSSSTSPDTSSSSSEDTTTTTAAEMHILQWGFHPPASPEATTPDSDPDTANSHASTVIFTHLAQFKLHGAYSEPHTLITHHLDLADSAGLVLMNGTVVPDRGVSVNEAKLLSLWLQRFYDWGTDGTQGGKKAEILEKFTAGDTENFKIEELMEEVDRV